MKMEKYALLDTDFISKTHFIQGNTEKSLSDLVVEMPGYCFFCHSQIIKELSRQNQRAKNLSSLEVSRLDFVLSESGRLFRASQFHQRDPCEIFL